MSQLQQLNSDLQNKMLYSNAVKESYRKNYDDKAMKSLLRSITPQICDNDKVCVCFYCNNFLGYGVKRETTGTFSNKLFQIGSASCVSESRHFRL